jgi:hypothetical protein
MGFLSSKETFRDYDIIFKGIRETSYGDFYIKVFPEIDSNMQIILKKNEHNFRAIYSKLNPNNVYTIVITYKPSGYMYDTFYLIDVLPPNIYKITRKVIDVIDIEKEINKQFFQLVFNKSHNKRIIITNEQNNNIIVGKDYDIYFSKCEYGYLYLVKQIILCDQYVTYNKKTLMEETFLQN